LAKKSRQPGKPPAEKKKRGVKTPGGSKEKKPAKKPRRNVEPAPAPSPDNLPVASAPVEEPRDGHTGTARKSVARSSNKDLKKKDNRNLIDKMITEEEGGEIEEPVDPEASTRGDSPMTLVGHLTEMRSRLLVVLISVLVLLLAGFGFSDYILMIISRPFIATGQKLNLFTLFEGFTLRLKGSLFASVLICLPLIIYQVWKYIEPAINRNDRTMIRITLASSVLLFYTGVTFTYFFLPLAISALMAFAPPDMLVTNNATEYFNFFVMTAIILGAVFELPIVMLLLTKMGIVSPAFLTSKRKYAIVLIWIVAALASPGPDPLSQALLALPLMLLYELSIVISKLIVRRKKKKELAERM
jgi:sec-independent protein translocase protein TatC